MFIKNNISKIVALSLIASTVHAVSLDPLFSFVASPRLHDTIVVRGPVVMGVVTDTSGKPVRNKLVMVYVDKRKVAVVSTNHNGVWSYTLNQTQYLQDSAHMVEACVTLSATNMVWTQATMFTVQASRAQATHRSGNVNTTNSTINFPFGYVNTTTPVVVGSLLDAGYNPVAGETVNVQINGVTVGTVTSDSNGVFSYQVSNALVEGDYTVGAQCVQSAVDLTINDFTVDITPPVAPTITYPAQNNILTTSDVIITGITEPNATVTIYLDGNAFGDISYADAYGNWSMEYILNDGFHAVNAQATDLANNTGPVCTTINFNVNA